MAGMGHGADGADGRCYLELLGQEGKEHADLHEEGASESHNTSHRPLLRTPEPSTSSAQRNHHSSFPNNKTFGTVREHPRVF